MLVIFLQATVSHHTRTAFRYLLQILYRTSGGITLVIENYYTYYDPVRLCNLAHIVESSVQQLASTDGVMKQWHA